MKAIIQLIIAILFIALTASAHPYGPSTFSHSIDEDGLYSIEINGIRYNATNGVVVLDAIPAGRYNVRELRHEGSFRGNYRTRVVFEDRISVPANSAVSARFDQRFGMHWNIEPLRRIGHMSNAHCRAMHPSSHAELINTIASTPFDNSKLSIAKSAISNNSVTSSQVREVMHQMTFDRNKLDIAKFAFAHCVDPHNYFLLANEFTFDNYSRELMRYIQ